MELTWENIEPPAAGAAGRWKRLTFKCPECRISLCQEKLVCGRALVPDEENMLELAKYSMLEPFCPHYMPFLEEYGRRGPIRRKAAERLIWGAMRHAELVAQAREDLKHAKPARKRKRKRRRKRRAGGAH